MQKKIKIIEATADINRYIQKYPNTRATKITLVRREKKRSTYIDYAVGEPLVVKPKHYRLLTQQITAYLNICNKLCEMYFKNEEFKEFVYRTILRFESNHIIELVENDPVATLSGVRFGSDIMVDQKNRFISVEVNLGPAGGPPEGIKAMIYSDSMPISFSPDTYVNHFINSIRSYYEKACKATNKIPKTLKNWHLVIVENDEWTPGNFIYLELLKKMGLNIHIAPKEALLYDEQKNILTLQVENILQEIDTLILFFHIQDDIQIDNRNENEIPGHLIKALKNKAVFLETSLFPLIILASKSIAGLISQLANNPDGELSKKLKLNKRDLAQVKDMFPSTYHWKKEIFTQMEKTDFSKFEALAYLNTQKLVVKSTITRFFAGQGVYGADHKKGRKGYKELYEELEQQIVNILLKGKQHNVLRILTTNNFRNEFEKFIKKQPKNIFLEHEMIGSKSLKEKLALLEAKHNISYLKQVIFTKQMTI